jgi:hypothetical protein
VEKDGTLNFNVVRKIYKKSSYLWCLCGKENIIFEFYKVIHLSTPTIGH